MPLRRGATSTIAVSVVLLACNPLAHELPARYDPAVFTPERGFPEAPIRLGDGPSGSFLIVVPVEGGMAFTTPSNYLGLYDSSGRLEHEVRLGAYPVELVSWDGDSIVLRSPDRYGMSQADRESTIASASRVRHLGSYRVRILVD